jgi:NitT/TauT family transport system substrate-binding protein
MPQRKCLMLSLSKHARRCCSDSHECSGKLALVASLLLSIAFSGAVPAQAETVKVGISKLLGYVGVPVANAQGYFTAEGIDIDMVYFDSAQPIAVAVASGDVDFGVSGMSAGFYTLAAQGQLRLIASSGGEAKGYHNLVYLGSAKAYDAGLKSLADMPGHSIAITQIGTSLHYAIGLLAEKEGFALSAVTVKPLQSNTNVIAALTGGTVDAAVMPSSVALPALQRSDAKLLGWVSDVAPTWSTGSAAFTSTKATNDRGDLVRRFLVAYRKGMRDFHDAFVAPDGTRRDGPTAPAILAIMSSFTGIAPEELLKAIPYVDREGRIAAADIARQIAWYKAQNLLRGDVKAEELIDSRYAIPLLAAK